VSPGASRWALSAVTGLWHWYYDAALSSCGLGSLSVSGDTHEAPPAGGRLCTVCRTHAETIDPAPSTQAQRVAKQIGETEDRRLLSLAEIEQIVRARRAGHRLVDLAVQYRISYRAASRTCARYRNYWRD
jgi:hypothetical protein